MATSEAEGPEGEELARRLRKDAEGRGSERQPADAEGCVPYQALKESLKFLRERHLIREVKGGKEEALLSTERGQVHIQRYREPRKALLLPSP